MITLLQVSPDFTEVSKQLVEIHKQLDSVDTIKTLSLVVSILSPIFIGVFIFQLNKGKDHHSKKSELCGELFGFMMDFRLILLNITRIRIIIDATERLDGIIEEEIYIDGKENPYELDQREQKKRDLIYYREEIKKFHGLYREVIPKISKSSGQFRLYLSKNRRKQFDELANFVLNMKPVSYSFKTINSDSELNKEIDRLEKIYRTDLDNQQFYHIDNMVKFIDENVSTGLITEID